MAVPERQTDEVLTELLLRWQDAEGDARSAIEDEVRDVFQETCAVFVLDMSGFSETVIKYDILHFLARIHQMRSVVVPLVEKHGPTPSRRRHKPLAGNHPQYPPVPPWVQCRRTQRHANNWSPHQQRSSGHHSGGGRGA